MITIRSTDSNETAIAWCIAINNKQEPTALALPRQTLPLYKDSDKRALKGEYLLKNSKNKEVPRVILMASGSKVELIFNATKKLAEKGIDAIVVGMQSFVKSSYYIKWLI